MLSLSDNNQDVVSEAFNSTSRYLDNLLNIDNPYSKQMVVQIYPAELQLNKATEAQFWTWTYFKNSSATEHIRASILWWFSL